jgi:hypothetical protein
VATGADADLLVLDEADRLSDLMAGGVWHIRDGQQRRSGYFEPAAAGGQLNQGR